MCPRDDRANVTASYPFPIKVAPSFRPLIWGRKDLSYLYPGRASEPAAVGEVWLTSDNNVVASGPASGRTLGEVYASLDEWSPGPGQRGIPPHGSSKFPLLVKFLFTSDKLSVQVHPPDDYANRHEASAGKTEM